MQSSIFPLSQMSPGTITHAHMHNSNMYSQVVAMTSHEVAVSLGVCCARQTKLQSHTHTPLSSQTLAEVLDSFKHSLSGAADLTECVM